MKTAINNVKIFDGEKILFDKGAVLFDETGILEIAKEPFQADCVIDGAGKTLTPGLIDGHVHMGMLQVNSEGDCDRDKIQSGALIAHQAQNAWRYGITTLCNCCTAADADIYVRNLIREGIIPGARIIACGRGICITGGHGWPTSHQCDDDTEVLRAARTQIRQGADLVKVLATGGMGTKGSIPNVAQLTESQMRQAAEAAEAVGVLTRAHATGIEGAQRAIRAGIRIIDHIQLDEETAKLMAEAGAYYCPTIVTRYNILHTEDPRYQYMRAKANPQDLDRKKRALELCKEHGITILAGTDGGPNDMTPIGSSLWTELNIYCEFGLSTLEALRAATKDAAEALRLTNVTGRICAGLAADIAVFDGDPTENMKDINTLCMTFQNGVLRWKA